jgi:hypothetical protein
MAPTPLTDMQLSALMADLNPSRITRRSQGGSQLSYLEAYDVKATLIKVFGFGGFSAEVTDSKIERILTKEETGGAKWTVLATATVKLTIHQLECVYTETASSSQAGSQIGEVADFALKTAESDALKRCAIYLGTQFGLSLYNKGSHQDIVKVILAPGQEFAGGRRAQAWVNGRPVFEAAVEQAAQEPAQEAPAQGQEPAQQPQEALPWGNGLTPEQQAANQALLDRGLRMAKEREEAADEPPMALAGDRDE